LQFLENKEMRVSRAAILEVVTLPKVELNHLHLQPNLVRVLSVILRFTPQELRRLNAKLSA
jgi:hypothetical protein